MFLFTGNRGRDVGACFRAPRQRTSNSKRRLSRVESLRWRPGEHPLFDARSDQPDNVSRLRVAWTYDTGDATEGSEMECNPIIVHGVVYATSPQLRVIALDATTGKLLWKFTPIRRREAPAKAAIAASRIGKKEKTGGFSLSRSSGYMRSTLGLGKSVAAFGEKGRVDIRRGLGRDPETTNVSANTPGIIYKDLLILGNHDSEDLPSAPGDIRAYDVRTGKLRWSFHTIPYLASSAIRRGQRMPGNTADRPTAGAGWLSMKSAGWYSLPPAPRPLTSTEPIGLATTCSPTRCSP